MTARWIEGHRSLSLQAGRAFLARGCLAGLLALVSPFWLGGYAQACAFHFYAPQMTAIDHLIASDHVVAARPDPADPFRFAVTETLVDSGRDIAINRLVTTAQRQKFAREPDTVALFAHDPVESRWVLLGTAGQDLQDVAAAVLDQRATWADEYTPERLAIAEALQNSPNPALRRLALAELDRAPYALLRTLDLQLSANGLLDGLWAMSTLDRLPIRVLLLGLSDDARARHEIVSRIEAWAPRQRADYLGVYATALIEIDGEAGVDRLNRLYLEDPLQPVAKIEAVAEALAIHSLVSPDPLRGQIADALDSLVLRRPETASAIARQLASRSIWFAAGALQTLVDERRLSSAADFVTVAVYLSMAGSDGVAPVLSD